MTNYKDESWLLNNRYSLLWVLSFVIMVAYATVFDDNEATSESTNLTVAIPYVAIAIVTFLVQQFKWLGTKR